MSSGESMRSNSDQCGMVNSQRKVPSDTSRDVDQAEYVLTMARVAINRLKKQKRPGSLRASLGSYRCRSSSPASGERLGHPFGGCR